MSEKLTIKYFPENELAKEPFPASEDAAGYDVFAWEAKTILPKMNACICLDFKMAIPKGFYGKIFLRSGLFRCHLATCDAGVIDADYRGSDEVLLMNHHPHEVYTARTGDRIGQIVFMKKYDVTFEKVSDNCFVVSYVLIVAFHPGLKLNRMINTKKLCAFFKGVSKFKLLF